MNLKLQKPRWVVEKEMIWPHKGIWRYRRFILTISDLRKVVNHFFCRGYKKPVSSTCLNKQFWKSAIFIIIYITKKYL